MQPAYSITVHTCIWTTAVCWIKHFGQRVHKLQLLIELKIITSKFANYESEVLQKEILKIPL